MVTGEMISDLLFIAQVYYYCYYDQVINKTHLKLGCLQFLLKCKNTKVQEIKHSVTFIVGLILILWNGLLSVQSIE